mmetsp:Transcript_7679/g.19937  ORF Transcript_7679/g.19937 Transcript_7679/m.19937 type:complete len:336 (-) Transcript_7679:1206-2213(-)
MPSTDAHATLYPPLRTPLYPTTGRTLTSQLCDSVKGSYTTQEETVAKVQHGGTVHRSRLPLYFNFVLQPSSASTSIQYPTHLLLVWVVRVAVARELVSICAVVVVVLGVVEPLIGAGIRRRRGISSSCCRCAHIRLPFSTGLCMLRRLFVSFLERSLSGRGSSGDAPFSHSVSQLLAELLQLGQIGAFIQHKFIVECFHLIYVVFAQLDRRILAVAAFKNALHACFALAVFHALLHLYICYPKALWHFPHLRLVIASSCLCLLHRCSGLLQKAIEGGPCLCNIILPQHQHLGFYQSQVGLVLAAARFDTCIQHRHGAVDVQLTTFKVGSIQHSLD